MTRITESQLSRSMLGYLSDNRQLISKLGDEISSGIAVSNPGDSNNAATISQFQQSLAKAEGYKNRIASVKSTLNFQDSILTQANQLLIRAKEIATQASNETNSPTIRSQMAEEVFQIRDHLVSLANSQYQGKYVYGGIDDDDPPYDPSTYVTPATGDASKRYAYDVDLGSTSTRSLNITDNLSITVSTPGGQIFDNGIQGLERLGRALSGYETLPAAGAPDGTGAAYVFPTDFTRQTQAIKGAMDILDTSRNTDIMPETVDIAGRMRRIETAESLIDLTTASSQEALDRYQGTDVFEASTKLTQAQTALQASLLVNTKLLKLSILDFV